MTSHARSWLYVPATSPRLLDKAMAGAADAVVVDLEDSVPAAAKDAARASVLSAVASPHPKPLWVRINDPSGAVGRADVRALTGAAVGGVRVPKAEDPDVVATAAGALGVPLHLLIESALGLQRVYDLARCHPGVVGVSLGETDLAADLRIRDRAALDWARQQVVTAARAAQLASPVHSVWTDVRDTAGLARDTRHARDHGFFGRSVIHPCQIDVVNSTFTPEPAEVEAARALVASLHEHEGQHEGGWLDEQGRFVDEAVVARARWIVDLADALPAPPIDAGRKGHRPERPHG